MITGEKVVEGDGRRTSEGRALNRHQRDIKPNVLCSIYFVLIEYEIGM